MTDREKTPYYLHHGDAIEHMAELPSHCMDLSIYSPPFPQLFSYTSLHSDLGNSENLTTDAKVHFQFFFNQIIRILKPGRVMVVHCMQIPRMKRTGGVGLFDFRGFLIRLAERSGFVFEYDWLIDKNPQAQALRTRSRELQFAGLESDRAKSRGALPDYLLKFRAPGENEVPIDSTSQVSRNEWIAWAQAAWTGIRENETLNVKEGRGDDDCRHICPLNLTVVNRLIRLYSNPGEVVFDPFAGIGTTGYMALKLYRRFYGCELKDEYFQADIKNLERALRAREEASANSLPFMDQDPEDDEVDDNAELEIESGVGAQTL